MHLLQPADMAIETALHLLRELHVYRLNTYVGAWVQEINEQWTIAANGHSCPIEVQPNDSYVGLNLQPHHFAVWYEGWLAGLFNIFTGVFIEGDRINERTFTAAVNQFLKNRNEKISNY